MILFLEFLLFILFVFILLSISSEVFLVFVIVLVLVVMHVNFSLKYFSWVLHSLISTVYILLLYISFNSYLDFLKS